VYTCSMLNPRDEVCKADGWGFVGYIQSTSACGVLRVPLGVFTKYCDGAAMANSWMKSAPKAIRWEAEQLYQPLTGGANEEA